MTPVPPVSVTSTPVRPRRRRDRGRSSDCRTGSSGAGEHVGRRRLQPIDRELADVADRGGRRFAGRTRHWSRHTQRYRAARRYSTARCRRCCRRQRRGGRCSAPDLSPPARSCSNSWGSKPFASTRTRYVAGVTRPGTLNGPLTCTLIGSGSGFSALSRPGTGWTGHLRDGASTHGWRRIGARLGEGEVAAEGPWLAPTSSMSIPSTFLGGIEGDLLRLLLRQRCWVPPLVRNLRR